MGTLDPGVVREIQASLREIGMVCYQPDKISSYIEAYVRPWEVFLRNLGYDPDGEDAALFAYTRANYCALQMTIWTREVLVTNFKFDLPEQGRRHFLSRCGTGDVFKDEVLLIALSKYSAKEIRQRAVKKVSCIVNEIWRKYGNNSSFKRFEDSYN
jgi:long-subunit acyl-CoA synthetase (AMP-forming)